MEKFPKGEMGWVNETTVKEYIDRNYVPKDRYESLRRVYAELLKKQTETQNALDYFVDDLINYSGERELLRSAIKGGFSKDFIWREIYADNDLYEEIKTELLDYCKKYIAKYACPREIEFREDLPKTLVGKVAYHSLEEEAEKEMATA